MELDLVYYFNWRGLEHFQYEFDRNGIPVCDYTDIGKQYNPITISQFGLFCLQQSVLYQSKEFNNKAMNCADWLIDNLKNWEHGILAWIYTFDLTFYGKNAPWISAMAQAEGISLLIRIFQLVQHEKYIKNIEKIFRAFHYPVHDGGVLGSLADSVVFEEYPASPQVHVLNGHIFSLLGVFDYEKFFGDTYASKLKIKGLETLQKYWQLWDNGFWTLYDLHKTKRLASFMYHKVHIQQMKILYDISGNPIFEQIAKRWLWMQKKPENKLRWFVNKSIEKVKLWGRLL